MPIYLTKSGPTMGKARKDQMRTYTLITDDGREFKLDYQRKPTKFHKGQVVRVGVDNNKRIISPLFTEATFIERINRRIDRMKEGIRENEAEIVRLRAL